MLTYRTWPSVPRGRAVGTLEEAVVMRLPLETRQEQGIPAVGKFVQHRPVAAVEHATRV